LAETFDLIEKTMIQLLTQLRYLSTQVTKI